MARVVREEMRWFFAGTTSFRTSEVFEIRWLGIRIIGMTRLAKWNRKPIYNEEDEGGRAKVTTNEKRFLRGDLTEIKCSVNEENQHIVCTCHADSKSALCCTLYTLCLQNVHLFIFGIILPKLNRFFDFWYVKCWENLTSTACTFAYLTCTL